MGPGRAPEIQDAAERMSVDEPRALQLERLRWTLRQRSAGKMRRVVDHRDR